jgi:hypothetical protein
MPFQVFTSYGAASRIEATLRASGYLFIPQALFDQISDSGDTTKLVLLVDAEHMKLGVRLATDTDPASALRDATKENSGVSVNIVPIMRTMKLVKPKKKLRLDVTVDGNMLVLSMAPASDLLN